MDYDHIEKLVCDAKTGNRVAKENLVLEFTPLINSIARKTFIYGYENSDLKNECFITLFNCLLKYQVDNHRFVAYATNSIKNNINDLIRKRVKRNEFNDLCSMSLSEELDTFMPESFASLDDALCIKHDYNTLIYTINNKLNNDERELVDFLFFKGNTLINYAYFKNVSYVTATKRKKKALKKLRKYSLGGINYGN